jgi:hypothetical protein
VINADNGPENSGVRSQWLKRLVAFSAREDITIQLAYYPPYHSKYNPIERVFGVLENYWNGDPLRTVEKALGHGGRNDLQRGTSGGGTGYKVYATGIKLNNQVRRLYEQALCRLPELRKWSITVNSTLLHSKYDIIY